MIGMPNRRRDFLISFTDVDRPWARWLARVLEEEGYSFWSQDQDFAGSIPRSIAEAHANSERTILVLSDAYTRSSYCRSEWEMRYKEDPGGARDLLVTFRVGPCTPDPLLDRLAHRDLYTLEEAAARELVRQRLHQAAKPGYRVPLGEAPFPGRRGVEAPFPVPRHNLPQPNRAFVGRTTELDALAQALVATGRSAITQPRAITGLGGIGKTQLALAYAYTHLAGYDLIRWLRAEEPAVLAADYAGVAPALGLDPETPDQAALIAAIRSRLEGQERWLLVFDNATEPRSLDPYLPRTGSGHVLVTARRTDWRSISQLPLGVMPEGEALELLTGRGDPEKLSAAELAEAKLLADDLGYLPLALAQARAYMDEAGKSLAGYRALLGTRRPAVLAKRKASPDYPASVAKTWDISLEAATAERPAARPLLELLAFFATEALSEALLAADPAALPEDLRDELERDDAVAALNRFSLIRAEAGSITVHRLVQAVTRDGLDETTLKVRAETALRLVYMALPRPGWKHENWPTIDALLPHALEVAEVAERFGVVPEATVTILNETALYLEARAAWLAAEPLFQRAVDLQATVGSESPEMATLLSSLARVNWTTGRYDEAEQLLKRSIAIGEKSLGPEHPSVGDWLSGLAHVYRDAGHNLEAELLFWRAITIGEKTLGAEHPTLAFWLNGLGVLYFNAGLHTKAEPLFRCAVHIGRKSLGSEHPDFATWLNNLGDLYRATRRRGKAEPLLRRALRIREKALGPNHPDVAETLNNLGVLHGDAHRPTKAEPLLRRSLTIIQESLASDHPRLVCALTNLAHVLDQLGGRKEAAGLRARAEAILRQRRHR